MLRRSENLLAWCVLSFSALQVPAPPAPPLNLTDITVTNSQATIRFRPYPAADRYRMLGAGEVTSNLNEVLPGAVSGYTWTGPAAAPARFYRLEVTPMESNALLTATVLNRLAYGPTPDELERLAGIGPQAYIDEQLAFEGLVETLDAYVTQSTNGVNGAGGGNWVNVRATGLATGNTRSNIYIYFRGVGEIYLDDLRLVSGTNVAAGPNLLVNGDFESPLAPAWTVSTNLTPSSLSTAVKYEGNSSLRLVSTSPGSGQSSSIWQTVAPVLTNNELVTLSFWYLPTTNSHLLTIRNGGSSLLSSAANAPSAPAWVYATATGTATANRNLYIYLSGAGEAYLDDIQLVAGSVPGAGPNLLVNADFESGNLASWVATANFTNSSVSTAVSRSGGGSLRLVATAAGSGSGNALYQTIPALVNGTTYTVSYWYLPATRNRTLIVRLSGSQLLSSPDTTLAGLRRRLDMLGRPALDTGGVTAETMGGATLADLRAWYMQHAIGSRRQLLEVLIQFLENHFVTQHSKSYDYLDRYYGESGLLDRLATDWDYREISKWRTALLRPDCTFYDLLRISAESPAMIVYLDTVDSRGNGSNIANENYARELFELFCLGVDNGYDQSDIVAMSRAWTGWSVDIVDPWEIDNPHAPRSTTYGFYPGSGYNARSNLVGVWTFKYRPENHGTNRAPIFPGRTVPARFGAPWAGLPYQLNIPPRTGTASIQDGYDVIQHLADLPFTMEYISVKLCRLFIHDGFVHGVYDYTDPNRPAEAELIRQCLETWWNTNPKGQIRPLLRTIFNSELFRSHGGSLQKVKTPLEFAASTIRALRSENPDGTFTAGTDGYSIVGRTRTPGTAPLTRMGLMLLFDRAEPDGYPESGPPWISAGTLAERTRFVQTTLMAPGDASKDDGISGGNLNVADPVALLKKKLPAGVWNDAAAVADYFTGILFPGEGRANLDLYRQAAVNSLNSADNGLTASPFAALAHTSTAYDTRVRGMAAMLMSFPRFQEQ